MKTLLCVLACTVLLSGCSSDDLDNMLSYDTPGQEAVQDAYAQAPAPAAATPVSLQAAPAEPANADFCRAVARQDSTANGFDAATQARSYAQGYAQCLVIHRQITSPR